MEKELEKKMGILSHIYDYLNGGYFASHNQLRYYDEKVYHYYKNADEKNMITIYNEYKKEIPAYMVNSLEKSAGIRYFICDSCHDSQVIEIKFDNNCLVIKLDTTGMLGCLDLNGNKCSVILSTFNSRDVEKLLLDFNRFERIFWVNSDIDFKDNFIYLELNLQGFNKKGHEGLDYKFKILDIKIDK